MNKRELSLTHALRALADHIKEALARIGKDPEQDPLLVASYAALNEASVSRDELERRHLHLALTEISTAAAKLASFAQHVDFASKRDRLGEPLALLDMSMARISRLGTDREFNMDGSNPMEEACRVLQFYANSWKYSSNPEAGGSLCPSQALYGDEGRKARDYLTKFGIPLAPQDASGTMIKE